MTPFLAFRRAVVRTVPILLVLAIGACAFGPSVGGFRPAQQPEGVELRIVGRGAVDVRGELVALRDTALIVRDGSRVLLVPWRRVDYLWVQQYGEYRTSGGLPDSRVLEQLRRVSRFPQGLTPEIERALLTAVGLQSLEALP